MAQPETRYAKSGDVPIAYQVTGEGPLDLVHVPGFVSHLEASWQHPRRVALLRRRATFSRLLPRVAALAAPGEVLASSTVKDLGAGSDLRFGDRGPHALRGVPGEWQLFAVDRGER